ncbi:MAG: hypothetical protein P1V97_17220 [Planctomycetota bacterium]|nr:hypothetical protein [Planctomycetota bacterium]
MTQFEYRFQKPGYQSASVVCLPKKDQWIQVRLIPLKGQGQSKAQAKQKNFAWTHFMTVNSASLQFITGTVSAATAILWLPPVLLFA